MKTLMVVLVTMLKVCVLFGLNVTGTLVGPLPRANASVVPKLIGIVAPDGPLSRFGNVKFNRTVLPIAVTNLNCPLFTASFGKTCVATPRITGPNARFRIPVTVIWAAAGEAAASSAHAAASEDSLI
jgi:hypothetical protein